VADGGGVRVEFGKNTYVIVSCPNCSIELRAGQPNHTVILHATGVDVEPEFSCSCGATMRVRRGKVQRTGWLRIPPRPGVVPATEEDPRVSVRPAIIVNKRLDGELVSPLPRKEVEVKPPYAMTTSPPKPPVEEPESMPVKDETALKSESVEKPMMLISPLPKVKKRAKKTPEGSPPA